jgi:hypothetical protein
VSNPLPPWLDHVKDCLECHQHYVECKDEIEPCAEGEELAVEVHRAAS